jgi:hypothetical protein
MKTLRPFTLKQFHPKPAGHCRAQDRGSGCVPRKALRGGISKSILQRPCQFAKWLRERPNGSKNDLLVAVELRIEAPAVFEGAVLVLDERKLPGLGFRV